MADPFTIEPFSFLDIPDLGSLVRGDRDLTFKFWANGFRPERSVFAPPADERKGPLRAETHPEVKALRARAWSMVLGLIRQRVLTNDTTLISQSDVLLLVQHLFPPGVLAERGEIALMQWFLSEAVFEIKAHLEREDRQIVAFHSWAQAAHKLSLDWHHYGLAAIFILEGQYQHETWREVVCRYDARNRLLLSLRGAIGQLHTNPFDVRRCYLRPLAALTGQAAEMDTPAITVRREVLCGQAHQHVAEIWGA